MLRTAIQRVAAPSLSRAFASAPSGIPRPPILTGNVYEGFADLVGNTPLVKLRKVRYYDRLSLAYRNAFDLSRACSHPIPISPLVQASELTGCDIYGKCEFMNPGGSVKDRAGLYLVLKGEADGKLVPGQPCTIVEGTAGNTGIGLTLAASSRGYRTIIVIPETQSQEKKDTLRYCGAHLIEVPAVPFKNPQNYVHIAARLAKALEDSPQVRVVSRFLSPSGSAAPLPLAPSHSPLPSLWSASPILPPNPSYPLLPASQRTHPVFYANQWDNTANRLSHVEGTGPEILAQLGGKVDAFSCAMGTGGTLAGVAEALRRANPNVFIGLTDPMGAVPFTFFTTGELKAGAGSSITEGIGQSRITGNMAGFTPDKAWEVPDDEALAAINSLCIDEGLQVGLSSGINVAGAMQVARHIGAYM